MSDLETAIRARDVKRVELLLREMLKADNNSLRARITASSAYRRLSLFHSALKVLGSELSIQEFGSDSPVDAAEAKLLLSRMLNLLGASGYALRILGTLAPNTRESAAEPISEILNSNYLYEEALPYFKGLLGQPIVELGYSQRLRLVSASDALFGAGEQNHALEILEEVAARSSEKLLLAISNQALGAYRLLSGDLIRAEKALQISNAHFNSDDTTNDRGFLDKWLGALLIHQGRYAEAKERLRSAWTALYRPGYKPEAWLEVLYWEGLIAFREKGILPTSWKKILAYPSPTKSRMEGWIRSEIAVPAHLSFGGNEKREALVYPCIDFESDLLQITHNLARWGLSYPQQLCGILLIAGTPGVPLFRASEALWPDELFSYKANLKRIEQLIRRSRLELGFTIKTAQLHVKNIKSKGYSCRWASNKRVRGWSFLAKNKTFTRIDVENYFGVSKRLAVNICNEWVTGSEAEKNGPFKKPSVSKTLTADERLSKKSARSRHSL